MLLNEIPWMIPLTVRLSNGLTRTFGSVEAVALLENEWPLRKGERYEQAVRTCRRALNRMTPAALAREAFIAACLEAGVPLVMAVADAEAARHRDKLHPVGLNGSDRAPRAASHSGR